MTKQNITTPLIIILGFVPIYSTGYVAYNYFVHNQWPQVFQDKANMYRKGNYIWQHMGNQNPDNFWDRRYYCWTSDPLCGLDIGPKRPWLDLKNPTHNLIKFHRDMDKSIHH